MFKGAKLIKKNLELHDFLREERVHKCLSSRSGHVGDWISCEDFALGNLRAERGIRENSFHSGRAPYEDEFIRVAHETQGRGELDPQDHSKCNGDDSAGYDDVVHNETRYLVRIRSVDFVGSSLDGEGKEAGATSAALRHTNRREQSDEPTGDSGLAVCP